MQVHVARQPIFTANNSLYGYEFLYRNGVENRFSPETDGSSATRSLLSSMVTEFGLDSLTGGAHAFVNFTRELIDEGCPLLFRPEDFVVEILEDVAADDDILARLRELRGRGYTLAMDDYTGAPEHEAIVALSDIVKVDFLLTTPAQQEAIARRLGGTARRLLAEKIETKEDLERARDCGYSLFQGYYFSRPVVLSRRSAQVASATYSRLWEEMRRPEPDFSRLADIIRADVNLSYKLLARANSSAHYRGHRVNSVRAALIRMGIGETRRWVLSVLMRDLTGGAGDEAAKRSLVRALFCEGIARAAGLHSLCEDAYTAGLFSTIDLLLGGGMDELLGNLCVSETVRAALMGGPGTLGDLLTFARGYEAGSWETLTAFLERYDLGGSDVSGVYLRAVEGAESVFGFSKKPTEPAI